jgi:hypothetical protein
VIARAPKPTSPAVVGGGVVSVGSGVGDVLGVGVLLGDGVGHGFLLLPWPAFPSRQESLPSFGFDDLVGAGAGLLDPSGTPRATEAPTTLKRTTRVRATTGRRGLMEDGFHP